MRPEPHNKFWEQLNELAADDPSIAEVQHDFVLEEINTVLDQLEVDYLGSTRESMVGPSVRWFYIERSPWLGRGVGMFFEQDDDGKVWLVGMQLLPKF